MDARRRHRVGPARVGTVGIVALVACVLLLTACRAGEQPSEDPEVAPPAAPAAEETLVGTPVESPSDAGDGRGTFTLAFAGDVHFERQLAELLDDPESTVGPTSRRLAAADLAMVNLETAIAEGGRPTDKELEDPAARYWFRTGTEALDVLARSGVDVVTVANNHGVDFGSAGLEETLAAAEDGPVAVVGVGADADEAFAPHRVTLGGSGEDDVEGGTTVAVLAADASKAESADPIWSAGDDHAGLASAREDPPTRLLTAVEEASERGDFVVVYLHWGRAEQRCPSPRQRRLAQALADAGADVVVGAHAHLLQGAGMLGDTYVAYGLGDFLWYHGRRPHTGVLTVSVRNGHVVAHELAPARIPEQGGRPRLVTGPDAVAQTARWEQLSGCAGLAPVGGELPPYEAEVTDVGPALARRMASSHDAARCPVDLADLRHLSLSHVGFDGRAHTGELVVHADHAEDVVSVFGELYDARWPIRRMRLVSDYGGDDDRSMAADNTSAYNCRRVGGQEHWSDHAFGAAIDLNPVENPYVTSGGVLPPTGQPFASVGRGAGARERPGVIREGDVVTQAFGRIGWTWGGTWRQPDYQHFAAPDP